MFQHGVQAREKVEWRVSWLFGSNLSDFSSKAIKHLF